VSSLVAQPFLAVLFDFPLLHPTSDLEGAPPFAQFAIGGLLRSNAINSLLLLRRPALSVAEGAPRPGSGVTLATNLQPSQLDGIT
jgi:hypothetical protein